MQQIVILSSIEWGAAWQRHQIFASQLAAKGHEIFFVENSGFRNPKLRDLPRVWRKLKNLTAATAPAHEESGQGGRALRTVRAGSSQEVNARPQGICVLNPAVLPPTGAVLRKINSGWLIPRLIRRLRAAGLKDQPIVITYFPTATTLEMIRHLHPSRLIYDCASHFAAHHDAPKDFAALEQKLLDQTDVVTTDSDFLFKLLQPRHRRVIQVHQGVSEEFFSARPPQGPWKTFCYYGTWVPDLNPDFLTALAAEGFEVTVSGFMKADPHFGAPVKRLAPVPREKLVERLEAFDVFLMPHRIIPFHLGVIPGKIYECMAMGRPVIATPLPSLEAFRDLIYIAETPEEWVKIAKNMSKTETAAIRQKRIDLAREHTHEREFSKFYQVI